MTLNYTRCNHEARTSA